MAPFLLTILVLSMCGILALFLLKRWELRTGRMLAQPIRPPVSKFFHRVLFWIERVIPALVRVYSHQGWQATLSFIHRSVAFLVLLTERLLERALHIIHRSTDVQHRAAGEASAFLREVAEHKRKLLRAERGQVRFRKE